MRHVARTLLGLLLLGSCAREQSTANQTSPGQASSHAAVSSPHLLGYVEVTAGEETSVQWVDADLRPLALTEVPEGLDLKAVTTVNPTLDDGSTRYLYSTVLVRNGKNGSQPAARSNLTFLAVDDASTISDTAIRSVRSDTGASLNTESVARSILPAHRMNGAGSVNAAGADFVAYGENELAGLTPNAGGVLQPWGFAVRHCLTTACTSFDRTLPGNAAANQYDGRVTFAFKTPKGTTATTPKTVTALYAVYQDVGNTPRITQIQEEQGAGTVGGLVSVPVGFTTTKFPGSNLTSGTTLNSVRTSGTAAAPTAFLFTAVVPDPCAGPSGTLDPCFGLNGKVTNSNLLMDWDGMAIDSQGRIVVVGNTAGNFAVARFTAAGQLDSSFGSGGLTQTDFGTASDLAHAIAIDPQGRLVVAGGTADNFALARYTASGQLDPSFGTGGKVQTDFNGTLDAAYDLTLDTQGGIVVAGRAVNPATNSYDFAVARYNSNGQLDSTFGLAGKVQIDFSGSTDYGRAVALTLDGKVVISGSAYKPATNNYDFAAARLTNTGQLDPTFGTGGKVQTDFGGNNDESYASVLNAQNQLTVVGYVNNPASGGINFAAARYTASGQLDPSFGAGGKVQTDFGGSEYARSVALDSQQRLVVAGWINAAGNNDFAAARYASMGQLDPTFGNGGKVQIDLGTLDDVAYSVAVDPLSQVVVGGKTSSSIGLIRLKP